MMRAPSFGGWRPSSFLNLPFDGLIPHHRESDPRWCLNARRQPHIWPVAAGEGLGRSCLPSEANARHGPSYRVGPSDDGVCQPLDGFVGDRSKRKGNGSAWRHRYRSPSPYGPPTIDPLCRDPTRLCRIPARRGSAPQSPSRTRGRSVGKSPLSKF